VRCPPSDLREPAAARGEFHLQRLFPIAVGGQELFKERSVSCGVTTKSLAAVTYKIAWSDDEQPQTASWDLLLAPQVVEATLLAARNPADRVAMVEVGDGFVVLPFAILDDETVVGVIGVHRE
jgi:hypothetical protein